LTQPTPEIQLDNSPESFYRELLDAAPDAMIVVDSDGRIALVNGQAERLFGYSRVQLLGRPVESLLPDRFRKRHIEHRGRFHAAPKLRGMGVGLELCALRADGFEFPVEISLSPIRTPTGLFVASTIRDVTERQRSERALTDARNAAERAQKANTAFLAAASHDLRQPVQALSLLTGALRRTVKDPLALEMVASQQESLEGMTNLLNSLLDVSRLDAGAFEPKVEEFPVQGLFDRYAAEWSRQARQKKLNLAVCPSNASIRSDPDLLAEILQNLVSNAVRYTVQGEIRVSAVPADDSVYIAVADTGIGIEPDQLDNIFREFYQIRNPTSKREGFGLGLAITRRLANLLGHSIRVESQPGTGSTFTVVVPRAASTAAARTTHVEQASAPTDTSALIMLIEDDAQVANGWRLLFRAEGYRVAVADTADSARELAATLHESPKVIISDFYLADRSNGVQAVIALRDDIGACIPACIVTGDTSKIVRDVAKLENARVMNKPVQPDELLRIVRAATTSGRV
jgi:PAS domain S-box-containing protein